MIVIGRLELHFMEDGKICWDYYQIIVLQILLLVPEKLYFWKKVLDDSIETIKHDFVLGVKKAIVDFVLKDVSQIESQVAEFQTKERNELNELSRIAMVRYNANHEKIERTLFTIHPCTAALLDLWYREYR